MQPSFPGERYLTVGGTTCRVSDPISTHRVPLRAPTGTKQFDSGAVLNNHGAVTVSARSGSGKLRMPDRPITFSPSASPSVPDVLLIRGN